MKLKVFTLRFDPDAGGFDDGALQDFLEGKEALAVHEHFFVHEQVPTWALLISYREVERPGEPRRSYTARKDWRAELAEEDRPLYDALRLWRNELARRDGRPPYVLLTNRQLADITRLRPASQEALREVHGVGDAKCEALGEQVLALVQQTPPSAEAAAGEAVEEPPQDA